MKYVPLSDHIFSLNVSISFLSFYGAENSSGTIETELKPKQIVNSNGYLPFFYTHILKFTGCDAKHII